MYFLFTSLDLNVEVDTLQARPSTKILDVSKDMSSLIVCDDGNNVIKISLDSYYQHFPSHWHSHGNSENYPKTPSIPDISFLQEDKDVVVPDPDSEEICFGDTFWRYEALAASRQIDQASMTGEKKIIITIEASCVWTINQFRAFPPTF